MSAGARNQAELGRRCGCSQQAISKHMRGAWWVWPKRGPWSAVQVKGIRAAIEAQRAGNNFGAGMAPVGGGAAAPAGAGGDAADEAETLALKSFSLNPERVARVKVAIERAAKIRLERELLAGMYVRKEDVEKDRVKRVFAVRAKLMEIRHRAHLLVGKDEGQMAEVLDSWMKEACDYFAGGDE